MFATTVPIQCFSVSEEERQTLSIVLFFYQWQGESAWGSMQISHIVWSYRKDLWTSQEVRSLCQHRSHTHRAGLQAVLWRVLSQLIMHTGRLVRECCFRQRHLKEDRKWELGGRVMICKHEKRLLCELKNSFVRWLGGWVGGWLAGLVVFDVKTHHLEKVATGRGTELPDATFRNERRLILISMQVFVGYISSL